MEHIIEKAYKTKALTLQHMVLPKLPKVLMEDEALAQQLLHLQLRYCGLQDDGLPDFEKFGALLRTLQLGDNRLVDVPRGIHSLSHLTMLTLDSNAIKVIPEELMRLSQLQCLVLSFNEIEAIPDPFWGSFPQLEYLSMHHNKISRLTTSFYDLPPATQVVYLDHNQISTIDPPDEKSSKHLFEHLRTLTFSYNKLKDIPSEFFERLVKVKIVCLDHNQITELPEGIQSMQELEVLRLDCNQLNYLPETIDSLTSLIALDVDNNQLKTLPAALANLYERHSLEAIRMKNNPDLIDDEETISTLSTILTSSARSFSTVIGDENLKQRLRKERLNIPDLKDHMGSVPNIESLMERKDSPLKQSMLSVTTTGGDSTHYPGLSITQLPVFRQWDGGSCGYHALKNALIILLAIKYAEEREDISPSILSLVKSPGCFWQLFFYWQSLLLPIAEKKCAEAKAKGYTADIVWHADKLKIGIMERNYTSRLLSQDPILGEIGKNVLVIADLDYLKLDPYDAYKIEELHKDLSFFESQKDTALLAPKQVLARAFMIGISKSHWVTVVAYEVRKGEHKYIIADSSQYEDPTGVGESEEHADNQERDSSVFAGKVLTNNPNIRMIIDCLEGKDNFVSIYLDKMIAGFIEQSIFNLIDFDNNRVDPAKVADWKVGVQAFLSSLAQKLSSFGSKYVKEETKNSLLQYCNDICKLDARTATILKDLLDAKRECLQDLLPETSRL